MIARRRALGLMAAAGLAWLPAGGRAAAARRVYMVTWRGWTDTDRGFKDYFAQRRIPVELIVRDAGQKTERLAEFVAEVRETRPDLVYLWGTNVAAGMLGAWDEPPGPDRLPPDIPVVFTAVSQPVAVRLVRSLEGSGRPNVTGVQFLVGTETQLKALAGYRPFQRLGVIYNPEEPSAVQTVRDLAELAPRMGFELLAEAMPGEGPRRPEEIPPAVAALAARRPDWAFMANSSFLVSNAALFTKTLLDHGIPVFSGGEIPIKRGSALAGLVGSYYNVGQLAARQAEAILVEGRRPGDLPIEGLQRFSMMVNMPVARRLGLYPPMTVLRFAEIVE